MASENLITFDDATFEEEVLKSDVPVLVDFWAPWCQPCKKITPVVEELAVTYAGRAKIGQLNVAENQQVAQQYRVLSIPTLLLFHKGEPVQQLVGPVKKPAIEKILKAVV